ncbi:MAG: NAD-dependent epimerase/dehydratase family protein, partial [Pseudomonadota bacterium]|nr:NAD-dependent epimerase/dehydratase family protein [Pseudomonadota bacterium]
MTFTLVTGASGFIGRALVTELLARGIHARRAVRRAVTLHPEVDCVAIGEVDNRTDWHEALTDVGMVVHLAARVHVMHEPATDSLTIFRAINTEGTLNLARQAAEAGVCRFAFMSTIKVNGEGRDTPYTASDLASPQDPYAISKWEAEQGLRDIAARTGMEVVILRLPLVYGPGVGGNFLRLMRAVDKGWPLPLGAVVNRRS